MNRKALILLSTLAVSVTVFAQIPPDGAQGNPPPPGVPTGQGPQGGMPMGMPGMPGQMPGMGMPNGMGAMPPGAMEEITVPFLGLEASPADPALRAQLKMAGDAGLTVNFVSPDSPAKTAGVQQYDLLTKVDDQILFNPMQLQSLIRSCKSGDDVKLTVLRQGETKVLTAKLSEHKVPAYQVSMPMPLGPFPMGGGMMGGPMGMGADARTAIQTLSIGDGNTTVQLKLDNGDVTLTATNKAGEAIYTGPVGTKEQRAKLPDNVKGMLNELAINDLIQRMKSPRHMGGPGSSYGGGVGGPAHMQGQQRRPQGPGGFGGMGPGGGPGNGPPPGGNPPPADGQ